MNEAWDVAQQAEGDIDDGISGADPRLDPDCGWRCRISGHTSHGAPDEVGLLEGHCVGCELLTSNGGEKDGEDRQEDVGAAHGFRREGGAITLYVSPASV